jgi:hypothetical protein
LDRSAASQIFLAEDAGTGIARLTTTTTSGFFPSDIPLGSKRNSLRSPLNCRDAQRRADKWAGTPDEHYLNRYAWFAKPFRLNIHVIAGTATANGKQGRPTACSSRLKLGDVGRLHLGCGFPRKSLVLLAHMQKQRPAVIAERRPS